MKMDSHPNSASQRQRLSTCHGIAVLLLVAMLAGPALGTRCPNTTDEYDFRHYNFGNSGAAGGILDAEIIQHTTNTSEFLAIFQNQITLIKFTSDGEMLAGKSFETGNDWTLFDRSVAISTSGDFAYIGYSK